MVEVLSRIQFAFTAAFHFLFVPLTIGLIILILIFEFRYYRKDDLRFKKLSDYFSDIFLINYAFGIVTGFAMTVQFGTNWANYSVAMGDIIASPLALEALVAFFLEATFTGIWIFRRNRISKKLRLITLSMIAIGTSLSAIWIITANGFMHNPVGASWDGTKMVLENFGAIVFNPYAWYMLIHNHLSAIILAAFVMLAISSYHLKNKEKNQEEFKIAAKYAAITILVVGILIPITGNFYMSFVNTVQPAKIEMISGVSAERLAPLVNFSFLTMVSLGGIFIALGLYTVIFFDRYTKSKTLQKIYMYLVPLPYIAITAGWIVTEVGRQPWVIYNIMKTKDAISNVAVEQVWFSLISIFVFYVILYLMDYKLTIDRIKKGFVESGESDE